MKNVARAILTAVVAAFGIASLAFTMPAAAAEGKVKRYLLIISVECISTTLGSDEDDLYFEVSNGKRFPRLGNDPYIITEGETWEPGYFVGADEALEISLMESDTISADDLIGTFKYDPNNAVGRFSENFRGDSSNYRVVFEFR